MGRFESLPQADQKLFRRCTKPIEPVLCGEISSEMYRIECLRGGAAQYAENRSVAARHRWLLENGCPPAMVEPSRFIAGDEEEEKAKPKPRPLSVYTTYEGEETDDKAPSTSTLPKDSPDPWQEPTGTGGARP